MTPERPDHNPATEEERLQLLGEFDMDSTIWPEHLNAIIQELFALRLRVAELEIRLEDKRGTP